MNKYSRQREALLTVLQHTDTHPNAEMLYAELRDKIPNISLGTVYRNLKQLADDGVIKRLSVGDGREHYDGNTIPHFHVVCLSCHRIFDIHQPTPGKMIDTVEKSFGGKIEDFSLICTGICADCSANQNLSNDHMVQPFDS